MNTVKTYIYNLLLWGGAIVVSFMGVLCSDSVFAASVFPDDLYVSYPKNDITYAVDISQAVGTPEHLTLITYKAHNRGNQLLNYEYRPEKDGYIITSGNQAQQVLGSTSIDTVKVTILDVPINNFTEFEDEYIWDINIVDNNYYSITNRKNNKSFTTDRIQNNTIVKLESYQNKDSQKFKIKTKNGIYSISSVSKNSMVWDIQGGAIAENKVISFPTNNQANQKWLVLFKPDDNAYVMSNYENKGLIVSQNQKSEQPKVKKNITPFYEPYDKKDLFYFDEIGEDPNGFNKVYIVNFANQTYAYTKNSIVNGISLLGLSVPVVGNTNQQWVLNRIENIPKPELKNVKISGTVSTVSSKFFIGENLKLTGEFVAKGFLNFDLYSKFDIQEPVLIEKEKKLDSGGVSLFENSLETSKFKEGQYYIELFGRGDSMFQSNRVALSYSMVYPTPTGDPISQIITKGTAISELVPKNFVRNLKDEIGSSIEVTKIENLDTNLIGEQEAIVTIKNDYKEVKIKVPVKIVNPKSQINLKFQKGKQQVTSLHKEYRLEANIGEKVNLLNIKEISEIVNLIESVKGNKKDYTLTNRAELEEYMVKDESSQDIIVDFTGNLTIADMPKEFTFSKSYIKKGEVQTIPLISSGDMIFTVHDSRAEGQGEFTVKAKMEKDLVNNDDENYTIKGGYIKLANDVKIDTKGFSQIAQLDGTSEPNKLLYEFTIGKWLDPNHGIELIVQRGAVKKIGSYSGTVIWELENGP